MPKRISPDAKRNIALDVAQGFSVPEASERAGVGPDTGYAAVRRYAPLINKIQAGQADQFRRILQKALDRIERIVSDPKSEKREVLAAAELASKMVTAGDRIGLMARAVEAKEREVEVIADRPVMQCTIEELTLSIAKDRGLLPAPAADEPQVIDVASEEVQ